MDRHFRPFHSPFAPRHLPRDPPDFHFETGSDFTYCAIIMKKKKKTYVHCTCIPCVCMYAPRVHYLSYTLYSVVKTKKKRKKNRPLIAHPTLVYVIHIRRAKYFVSKRPNRRLKSVRNAPRTEWRPLPSDVEIIHNNSTCHFDAFFFNGLPKYTAFVRVLTMN